MKKEKSNDATQLRAVSNNCGKLKVLKIPLESVRVDFESERHTQFFRKAINLTEFQKRELNVTTLMRLTKLSSQKHIPCTIKANRWRRNLRGKFSNRRTTYHAPKFKGVHRCTINGLKKASSFGWKVIQWLKEFRVRIQFLEDSSFGVLFHLGF